MTASLAFVTVSYAPDLDRCALLCRSLERSRPGVEHWIVVDRSDLQRSASLQNSRTTLVTTEDVLPLGASDWTLRGRTPFECLAAARARPVRGWLVQQLVKLALAKELTADVLLFTPIQMSS